MPNGRGPDQSARRARASARRAARLPGVTDIEYTALRMLTEAGGAAAGRGDQPCGWPASIRRCSRWCAAAPLGDRLGRARMFFNLDAAVREYERSRPPETVVTVTLICEDRNVKKDKKKDKKKAAGKGRRRQKAESQEGRGQDGRTQRPPRSACGRLPRRSGTAAARPTLSGKDYDKELAKLHGELVKLQEWVKYKGLKVCIVFEGRDGAGKGGAIKAITERVSPRVFRVVALPAPTEREKSQMYLQRYCRTCRRLAKS